MVDNRAHDPLPLGTVAAPSGVLVLIDLGYLRLWSGDQAPVVDVDGIEDPELRESAANSSDLRFVGAHAEDLARRFDRQSFHFVYDIPAHGVAELQERAAAVAREHGLDARLVAEPARVPHRVRARRAAQLGGGDFVLQGPWVGVAPLLDERGPFPVVAHPHDFGRVVGVRWQYVEIELSDRVPAAERSLGYVGVDCGVVAVGDADALASWVPEGSVDGLADVVYWGRDAAEMRQAFGGDPVARGVAGWRNLPDAAALAKAEELSRWIAERGSMVRVWYRPHSHHGLAMAGMEASPTDSHAVDVGGASVLAFGTSVGDGAFEMRLVTDATGAPVALRLITCDERRAETLRQVWERARRD